MCVCVCVCVCVCAVCVCVCNGVRCHRHDNVYAGMCWLNGFYVNVLANLQVAQRFHSFFCYVCAVQIQYIGALEWLQYGVPKGLWIPN